MANNLSSGEALDLLQSWKRKGASISVFCAMNDPTSFSLRRGKVTKVSEDGVQVSNEVGFIYIPMKDATFKRGNIEILALKLPPGASAPMPKEVLQIQTEQSLVNLIEEGVIHGAPSSVS